MKKMFLTSGIIICMVCPVFANGTGIPATNGQAYNDPANNCVEDVLGVSSGTAKLKAKWEPNTIHLQWNDNNATTAHSGGSDECTYDGDVVLPTNPTRLGYTFNGWKVVDS